MFISIKGEGFSEHIYKEIINITDHAILHIDDVKYDRENKTVHLLIERHRFRKSKKIFGIIEAPSEYDKTVRIKSSVIINKVIDCKIQNNYSDEVSETTIGEGVVVRDNKIYISSQDDYYGKPFYLIEIGVSDIDVTISDRE